MLYYRKHLRQHRLNLRQKCAVVPKEKILIQDAEKGLLDERFGVVIILVYLLLVEYFSSIGHHALRKAELGVAPGDSDKSDQRFRKHGV